MAIKRKVFAALAALALAGGIATTAVHGMTASADGPVVTGGGGSGTTIGGGGPPGGAPCIYPFDAE